MIRGPYGSVEGRKEHQVKKEEGLDKQTKSSLHGKCELQEHYA
jgi:hypothetical protein